MMENVPGGIPACIQRKQAVKGGKERQEDKKRTAVNCDEKKTPGYVLPAQGGAGFGA